MKQSQEQKKVYKSVFIGIMGLITGLCGGVLLAVGHPIAGLIVIVIGIVPTIYGFSEQAK